MPVEVEFMSPDAKSAPVGVEFMSQDVKSAPTLRFNIGSVKFVGVLDELAVFLSPANSPKTHFPAPLLSAEPLTASALSISSAPPLETNCAASIV